jgi:hypothetical protein
MATYGHQGGNAFNEDQRGGHHPLMATARGITTAGLDELDKAHKILVRFEDELEAKMREMGHGLNDLINVEQAIEQLIGEPVL